MNPANLTAAERGTILAALNREREALGPLTTPELLRKCEQIDRLCDRLSAPVADGPWKHDICEDGSEGFHNGARYLAVSGKLSPEEVAYYLSALNAHPPQAPEPVNAELLTTLKKTEAHIIKYGEWDDGCFYYGGLSNDTMGQIAVMIRNTLARAESALAAQKPSTSKP